MRAYGPLFNLAAGEAEKQAGRTRAAAKCRDSLLVFARDAVRKAAGSIFSGGEWQAAGWKPSQRRSNHARMIREWRLRG
jgi:hypothetical protein